MKAMIGWCNNRKNDGPDIPCLAYTCLSALLLATCTGVAGSSERNVNDDMLSGSCDLEWAMTGDCFESTSTYHENTITR